MGGVFFYALLHNLAGAVERMWDSLVLHWFFFHRMVMPGVIGALGSPWIGVGGFSLLISLLFLWWTSMCAVVIRFVFGSRHYVLLLG
jgi:hypothetical protein